MQDMICWLSLNSHQQNVHFTEECGCSSSQKSRIFFFFLSAMYYNIFDRKIIAICVIFLLHMLQS